MTSVASGIECVMRDGTHMLLPVGAIDQIIEYSVAPLPLARPFVGGVGRHDDALLISITLSGAVATSAERYRTGALLVLPRGSSKLLWAVELSRALTVANVVSVGRVVDEPSPNGGSATQSSVKWLTTAVVEDGRTLHWLDVPQLLREVGAC